MMYGSVGGRSERLLFMDTDHRVPQMLEVFFCNIVVPLFHQF